MTVLTSTGHALWTALAMFWEILRPLILGFTISGVIQAVVSKSQMARLLDAGFAGQSGAGGALRKRVAISSIVKPDGSSAFLCAFFR